MFVSNTSTLILLAKISLLQKFVDNSPKIIIPEEVQKEYKQKESFDVMLIEKEIENGKIIVQKNVKNKPLAEQFRLDKGEAMAYSLFDPSKHKAILTDDKELIKLCKIERIPFITSMAIVIRLLEKKIITKDEALNKLEKLLIVGRYSKGIYDYYKNEVNKNGNAVSKN